MSVHLGLVAVGRALVAVGRSVLAVSGGVLAVGRRMALIRDSFVYLRARPAVLRQDRWAIISGMVSTHGPLIDLSLRLVAVCRIRVSARGCLLTTIGCVVSNSRSLIACCLRAVAICCIRIATQCRTLTVVGSTASGLCPPIGVRLRPVAVCGRVFALRRCRFTFPRRVIALDERIVARGGI